LSVNLVGIGALELSPIALGLTAYGSPTSS